MDSGDDEGDICKKAAKVGLEFLVRIYRQFPLLSAHEFSLLQGLFSHFGRRRERLRTSAYTCKVYASHFESDVSRIGNGGTHVVQFRMRQARPELDYCLLDILPALIWPVSLPLEAIGPDFSNNRPLWLVAASTCP